MEGHLCICPTTQPLHQGAENAGKRMPESSIADCKVTGSNPTKRTLAFFILNLAIMCLNDVLLLQSAYSVPVGIYSIVMWQISLNGD